LLLSNDHRAAEELFGRLMNPKHVNRGVDRGYAVERLIRELTVHAEIEEELVYPAIRRNVEGGRRLAKHAEEEHQQVKAMLDELAEMDPESREAEALIEQLQADMEAHVAEEEGSDGLFDQLRASMDEESLQELGSQITEAKITKTVNNPVPEDDDEGNPPPKEVGGQLFHMRP
jgi:iron-sulfur cluster repair protein YtfE (RIC family)